MFIFVDCKCKLFHTAFPISASIYSIVLSICLISLVKFTFSASILRVLLQNSHSLR